MSHKLHERALEAAGRFKRAEADLIAILQECDGARVFEEHGYTSLFTYCVGALGLSESVTSNFITVARKAKEVPALQSAIESGELSVSKARKITAVVSESNDWVAKAVTMSSRELEREVALVAPSESKPERVKAIAADRHEVRLSISDRVREKLERVRDLESQRTRSAVTLEETLEAVLDIYLEAKDPVKRAERVLKRKFPTVEGDSGASPNASNDARAPVTGHTSGAVPSAILHLVRERDRGQCTQITNAKRCDSKRWIDIHHIQPRSLGGQDTLENLTTLCSSHHRMHHHQEATMPRRGRAPSRPRE